MDAVITASVLRAASIGYTMASLTRNKTVTPPPPICEAEPNISACTKENEWEKITISRRIPTSSAVGCWAKWRGRYGGRASQRHPECA